MREGREKFVLAMVGLEQLVLHALVRGQIARDLRCPDDVTGTVANGRDRQANLYPATVFGHALGLQMLDALTTLNPCQDLTLLIMQRRRHDQQDGLANRLMGTEAEDLLRPGVPGGHDSIGIEHEDRVLPDALDEQTKAFFAAPQLFFVGAALRQIARDFGEP